MVIPLTQNGKPTRFLRSELRVSDDQLPFDIEVVQFMTNSRIEPLRHRRTTRPTPATAREFRAVELRGASGASSSAVDLASGYFRFISKPMAQIRWAPFLLSQDELMMRDGSDDSLRYRADRSVGQTFDVQLRFLRNYKDYSLNFIDVSKDDYIGTSIPRNYSSQVLLRIRARRRAGTNIWMNNPRRYAGETFYQSGWQMDSSATNTARCRWCGIMAG